MADVVLVYPTTEFAMKKLTIDIPVSLLSIASTLIPDYHVKIIDQRLNPNWKNALLTELKTKPLCVGVSSMTGPQINHALEISKVVKENSDIKVVWGGVHVTLLPEQTLANKYIDAVCIGEGEVAFRSYVDYLADSIGYRSLSTVYGMMIKKDKYFYNDNIFISPPAVKVDLNISPELPYHLVNMDDYIGSQGRFEDGSTRSLLFSSSRGCPWRCSFCCNSNLHKGKWRGMSPEIAYERVSDLVDKYKLDAIAFHDEEFFTDIERANKLAKLINGKFKWWVQARMDRLLKVDLDEMERCGMVAVQPGIESGSPRILEMIRKGETVQDFLAANNRLSHTDIVPLYNYMMGFPSETKSELLQTVDLALRMINDNPKAQVSSFYVLIPYPGTELYEMGLNYGLKPPNLLEGWANFNRQHLITPWIQDNLEMMSSILNSSKFIDGARAIKRLKIAYKGVLPIPTSIGRLLGWFYRRRWSNYKFDDRLDSFISKVFLKLFSLSEIIRRRRSK